MDYDASGAFRCFKTNKIKLKDILSAHNNDYAFFGKLLIRLKIEDIKYMKYPLN